MQKTPVRILLADDHDVVRRGLRGMLEGHPGWQVCGEATDGHQAVSMTVELKPQVAVLDLEMPGLSGLEATRQIKRAFPQVEVLVYSVHETDQLMREAIAAGAGGYVPKSDAGRRLVEAVEALSRHKPFFKTKASESRSEELPVNPPSETSVLPELTGREKEIVRLLAEGNDNKEAATMLGISIKTVETHRAAVMRKLGIHSIVELVHYAVRNNLVKP